MTQVHISMSMSWVNQIPGVMVSVLYQLIKKKKKKIGWTPCSDFSFQCWLVSFKTIQSSDGNKPVVMVTCFPSFLFAACTLSFGCVHSGLTVHSVCFSKGLFPLTDPYISNMPLDLVLVQPRSTLEYSALYSRILSQRLWIKHNHTPLACYGNQLTWG